MNRDPFLETRVLSADPVELIHILYEHALHMVVEARQMLAAGDIAGRSKAISRAVAALSELDGSLNHAQGADISRNLARLYQYMRTRLTLANARQDDAPMAEVESLLETLAGAWRAIATSHEAQSAEPVTAPEAPPAASWGHFAAEMPVEYANRGWSA